MTTLSATSKTTTADYASTQVGTQRSARRRYAENIYFQDGITLSAILVSLLYLILATSLDAAGYVESMTILVPVTMGALGLGFLMSFSRFDGFFALSHSMFTGLAWILYLMSGLVSSEEIAPFVSNGIPEMQAEAYFVLLRWLNWVDAAINNVASNDNFIFIFEMCFLIWWLTYLGVWSVFRYGYTWRAIIPAGVVLLVNTFYAPQSIMGFLVIFCLLAILLFVRTNLAEQQLRWREAQIHYTSDVTFDFLRNGLAYSVAVVALAWLVPGFGRNLEVRTVMSPINEQWEATTQRMNRLYQGLNRQSRAASSSFGSRLTLGGERIVGDAPIFQARATEGRYWRAVVYDTYTGNQWLSTAEQEIAMEANESVPIPNFERREPLTQTVMLQVSTSMIFAPPDIISVDAPVQATVRDMAVNTSTGDEAIEVISARSQRPFETEETYTVFSAHTNVTQNALEEAGTDYPPDIVEQYLQLPDDFSQRVAEDAEALTRDLATPYAKARAVETYLRGITYNDNIEAPPAGRDPVEYFLYDIREGYCDYYATSMALMLRSVDIPSRVVSGYAEGEYNPDTGLHSITERDAHTWVEVYFPNFGWIEFEPTAGESQLNRPAGDDEMGPDAFYNPYNQNDGAPIPPEEELMDQAMELPQEPMPDDAFTQQDAGRFARQPWWVWALVTPTLLMAGIWVIWRTRISGPTRFDPNQAPILFERLQQWAARLGLTPATNHTPYEQAHHLARALPEGRTSIRTITEGYVHYRFNRGQGGQGRTATTTVHTPEYDELQGAWRVLEPMLWKRWLKKLIRLGRRKPGDDFTLTQDSRGQ